MSSNDGDDDDGPGRREVAHRLFAAEFDDVTVSYRESDEERAPNYVVTPTGARVNRLFAVGALTEVEPVNEDVVRARIADPTGVFVSYAGQYQPDALAFYERTDPPAFVALTGKGRTFEPEDSDRVYSSVRPESVNEVDADTRDRWVVAAAEATLSRVAVMRDALAREERGDDLRAVLTAAGVREPLAAGAPVAIERYGTTPAYLDAVREVALDALAVVAGERDAVRPLDVAPDEGGAVTVGPIPDLGNRPAGVPEVDVAAGETPEPDEPAETPSTTDAEPTTDGTTGSASTADSPAADTTADDPAAPESTGDAGAGPADDSDAVATESDSAANGPEAVTTADDPAADDPAEAGDADTGPADDQEAAGDDGTDELGDFDPGEAPEPSVDADDVYEMDDEERREVEEEFGAEFATGTEVDDPGEADIDVPGPEESVGTEAEATAGADGRATADADDDAVEPAEEADEAAPVDLEDAAVAAMEGLDDGDGADRESVVAAVVDEHDADPAAVEDAIQGALMSGRCYEPDEATLKPI